MTGGAFAAHAESPTIDNTATQGGSQGKTRDQLRAERLQARADGTTAVWSISYNPLAQPKSLKAREEMRAELRDYRQAQLANALVGEDSGAFYLAQQKPARDAGPLLATASPQVR